MMKSADDLLSKLFEYQFHDPVGVEEVRVTLHIGGERARLHLR